MLKKNERKVPESYNIDPSSYKFNFQKIQNELEKTNPEPSKSNEPNKPNKPDAESFDALNESAISALSGIEPSLGRSNLSNFITREKNKLITPRVEKMLEESSRIPTQNLQNLQNLNENNERKILNEAFIYNTPRASGIEPSSGLHRLISEIAGENYLNTIEDVTYLDRLDKQKLLLDIEKKNIEISQLNNLLQDLQKEYSDKSQRISDELKKQNTTVFELNKENQNLKIQLQENIQIHEQRIESMKRMIETKDIDIEKVRYDNLSTIDSLNQKIQNLEQKLRDRSLWSLGSLNSTLRSSETAVYPSLAESLKSKLDECQLQNRQLTENLTQKNQDLDMSVQTVRRLQTDMQKLSDQNKKCNELLDQSQERKKVLEAEIRTLKSRYDMLEKEKLYLPMNISRVISDIQRKIHDSNKIITEIADAMQSMTEKSPQLILQFQKDMISYLKTMRFNIDSLQSAMYEIVSKNENIKIFQSNSVYLQYALGQISYEDATQKLKAQSLKQDDTVLERITGRFEFSKKLSDYILSETLDIPSNLDTNQAVLVRRVASLKKIAAENVHIQKEYDIYKNAIDHILYEKELDSWSQEKKYSKMVIAIEFVKSKLQKFDTVITKFDELERNYSSAKREITTIEKQYSNVSSDQKYFSNVLFSCYRFLVKYIQTETDLDKEVIRLQNELKPSKLTVDNISKIINDFKTTRINIVLAEKTYKDLLERYENTQKKFRDLLEKFNSRDADFSNLRKIKEELEMSETQNKILQGKNDNLNEQLTRANIEKDEIFYANTELRYQLNDSQRIIFEAESEIKVLQSVLQKYADELRKKSELITKENRCREKYRELKTQCIRKIEIANSKINGYNQLKKLHKSTLSKQAKYQAYEKLQMIQFIKSMQMQQEEYERMISILESQAKKTDIRLNALRVENKELRKQLIKVGKSKKTEVTVEPTSLKIDLQISKLEDELIEKNEELKIMTENFQNISENYQKIYGDNQRLLSSIKEFEIKTMEKELVVKSKDDNISSLQEALTALKQENKKMKSENDESKKLVSGLENKVNQLTKENKDNENKINDLTEKYDNYSYSLQLEYNKNEELNKLLQEQKKISKDQIDIKDRLIKTVNESLNQKQESLDKVNNVNEQLTKELNSSIESFNKMQDKFSEIENEYKSFKLDYDKLVTDNEKLSRETNLLKEKIQKIKKQHKVIINEFMNKISLQNKVLKNLENNLIVEQKQIEKSLLPQYSNQPARSSPLLTKMKSFYLKENRNTQPSKESLGTSKSYTFGSPFKSE
jgi:chromosome segregation ATPase